MEILLLLALVVVIAIVYTSFQGSPQAESRAQARDLPSATASGTGPGLREIVQNLKVWQVHLYSARLTFHGRDGLDSKAVTDLAVTDMNAIVDHLNANPAYRSSMDAVEARTKVLQETGLAVEPAFAQAWEEVTGMDVTAQWGQRGPSPAPDVPTA